MNTARVETKESSRFAEAGLINHSAHFAWTRNIILAFEFGLPLQSLLTTGHEDGWPAGNAERDVLLHLRSKPLRRSTIHSQQHASDKFRRRRRQINGRPADVLRIAETAQRRAP